MKRGMTEIGIGLSLAGVVLLAALKLFGLALAATVQVAPQAAAPQSIMPKAFLPHHGIPAPPGSPLKILYSGYQFRNASTKAMQDDDFSNPGMLALDPARAEWSHVDGTAGKSCASCHQDARTTMHGVGATYPKWNARLKRPVSLEQQINICRTQHMGARPWAFKSENLTNMTTFIRYQSRGMPVNVQTDGPMTPWYNKGKKLYYTRIGQLDMSCANCHETYFGHHMRADMLSQGQINDFPTYREKAQHLVPVDQRFIGCMKNVRAKPYKPFSDEFLALELYVASRGIGLKIETPGVRN